MANRRKSKALVPRTELVVAPSQLFDGSIDGLARLIKSDFENLPDARRRIIELLRGEDDVKKFVKAADKLLVGKAIPGKGDRADLDLACERSGTNRSVVFGAVARVLHRYHFDVAQMLIGSVVANRAFEVATAMAENASVPMTGLGDRRLFMEVAGAKSRSGVGGVNVNVHTTANAQAGAKTEIVESGGRELPSFEEGIRSMAAKLRAIPARVD